MLLQGTGSGGSRACPSWWVLEDRGCCGWDEVVSFQLFCVPYWEGQMCCSFLPAQGLCCRVAADPQLAVPGGAPVEAQDLMLTLIPLPRRTQTWLGTELLTASTMRH